MWYLNAVLAAAAAVRLLGAKLGAIYPALAAYLLFMPARSALLMYFQSGHSNYAWTYVVTTPVVYGLTAWAGLEIYRLAFEAYNGIAVLGRRTLGLTVAAGALFAYLYFRAGSKVTGEPFPILRFVLLFEAWVAVVVLCFLVALIGFVLWFPVPLKRNVVAYSFGLCTLMSTTCAGIAMRVFGGAAVVDAAGTVIMAASAAVFGCWVAYLGTAGERVLPRGAVPRSTEDQARLLGQLNAINAMVQSVKNS